MKMVFMHNISDNNQQEPSDDEDEDTPEDSEEESIDTFLENYFVSARNHLRKELFNLMNDESI